MTVTITLTTSPGGRYDLYSDVDGYTTPFATNIANIFLINGYTTSAVPDSTFNIKVLPISGSSCTAGVILPIQNLPTPTPTVTSTLTPSPTAVFNPTYVADLFQWFDASFPSTIQTRTQTGSTYVTQWNARYGNSVSQSNTSLQPRYVESSYSFPYSGVQFDTVTQILTGTTSGTTPSGNTTFIVSYVPGTTQVLTWSLDTNNGEGISSLYVGSNKGEARSVGQVASLDPFNSATYYPKMLTFVSGNSSSVGATFDDVANNGSRTFTAGSTMTGMRMGFSGNTNAGMAIYEIIVYNRVLNTTEKNNIINYLKTKWEYSTWGATPTPTKTPTQTATPTMTLTNTLTSTLTQTPTPTKLSFAWTTFKNGGYSSSSLACANYNNVDTLYTNTATPSYGSTLVYTDATLTTLFAGGGGSGMFYPVKFNGTGTTYYWRINNSGLIAQGGTC